MESDPESRIYAVSTVRSLHRAAPVHNNDNRLILLILLYCIDIYHTLQLFLFLFLFLADVVYDSYQDFKLV